MVDYAIEIYNGQAVYIQEFKTNGNPREEAIKKAGEMKFHPESVIVSDRSHRCSDHDFAKNVLYVWVGKKAS